MVAMKPHQKAYLIKVAQSSDTVSLVQDRIKSTGRRYWLLYALCSFASLASTAAVIWVIIAAEGDLTYPTNYIVIGLYLVAFWLLYIALHSSPEYRTFNALIKCFSRVDNAVGSQPAASSRKDLANSLLRCARRMRGYRSVIPLKLHKRIMSHEATRASQALRQLVHPVILGTDEELRQVKETLAWSAILVGTQNWVQVGDLGSYSISKPLQVKAVLGSLLPWLVGVVVPLIATLVTALGS
jgi:hypothetical protein